MKSINEWEIALRKDNTYEQRNKEYVDTIFRLYFDKSAGGVMKIYMVDDKDREFEISIKYYDSKDDPYGNANFDILGAKCTLTKGKRIKVVELDEHELLRYIDEDRLAEKVMDEISGEISWDF